MNFLILASILCSQNQIGPLCYSMSEVPHGIELQILDIEAREYLVTRWEGDTMITKDTDENGCREWINDDVEQITNCN